MYPVRIVDLFFFFYFFFTGVLSSASECSICIIFLFISSSSSLLFVWFVAKRLFLRPLWANFREQLVVARFELPTNNNTHRSRSSQTLKHKRTRTHRHTFAIVFYVSPIHCRAARYASSSRQQSSSKYIKIL